MMRRSTGGRPLPWKPHSPVLVAAPDSLAGKFLCEALSRVGYRSELCHDSRRILEDRSTSGRSFLMVQAGEEGIDAVRELRKRGGSIPVILLSGGPPAAGGDGVEHLSTPFTLESLRRAITRALRRSD